MNKRELDLIKSKRFEEIKRRFDLSQDGFDIMVCSSTGCESNHSEIIFNEFSTLIKDCGLENFCNISKTGCFGFCTLGPIVVVYPGEIFYCKVGLEDVKVIIDSHIKNKKIVERLVFHDTDGILHSKMHEIPFYKKQKFLARSETGKINPERIDDYIATDGYYGLYKALTSMKPNEVINEISKSGLRGRGGAGFPTGKKWEFASNYQSNDKYVVCNGDEGDPGAFMDRSIVEGNPHAIVEALAIAGFAIGANHGIVYIRAEYPLAASRIQKAIDDARQLGVIGSNIFETSFSFDIEVRLGAGAFVCGEETALLKSCEGMRGEPVKKPPYPAERGFDDKPTIINNVETLSLIPRIILNGANWLNCVGTESSKGTKVFALTGKVNNMGLIELPMGATIREIVEDVGGGVSNNKKLKAVQMGGPSGGCVPASLIDTKIDYENLKEIGAMMGSGGMIVVDEDTCMVDLAKFFLEFTCDESCGKCTPCRIGNKRLLEILTKICDGKGEMSDLDELESLSNYIKENSLCGLGQTSPNPVLSTLKYFKDEYIEHIKNKRCPAGVCKNLKEYYIDKSKCIGCSACSKVCPVNAIHGEVRSPFELDKEKCIKCGKCFETCRFGAVNKR